MKRLLAGMLFWMLLVAARGQRVEALHPAGPLPQFDVATIKEQDLKNPRPFMYSPAGQQNLVHRAGTVKSLMLQAFGVQGQRVIGAPEWANKTDYFVEGKIPPDVFAKMQTMTPEDRQREESLMLQSLLVERLQLKVHFEKREFDAYDLVATGGSPLKLAKAKEDAGFPGVGMALSKDGVHLQGANATMQGLTSALAATTSRFVNDKTGLPGRFAIDIRFSPEGTPFAGGSDAEQAASSAPSLFAVLQDLGLKLVPSKVMVEVVVIDHIEMPAEN